METKSEYVISSLADVANDTTGSDKWTITDKSSADWALDKIRKAMEEKATNQAIANDIISRKQEEVSKWLASENEELDRTISFFRHHLCEWTAKELDAINVNKKKPVRSISLPCGKIGFKKGADKYLVAGEPCAKDNKALLEMVRASNRDFIKTEIIESVMWADFKKTLTVDNGRVISADGEVLEIEVVPGQYEFNLPKF